MSPQSPEIEIVTVTAADIGLTFLLFVLLSAAAVGLTAWVVRDPVEVESDSADDPDQSRQDLDRTVEIRRGPRRPPHTGTVHVPGVRPVPADDPTVVIRHPDGVSS